MREQRRRVGRRTVLVIHPDRAVRARLVRTIQGSVTNDDSSQVEVEAVASFQEAGARSERPDAIVTCAPPPLDETAAVNDGASRAALPKRLRRVPCVVVIDRPDFNEVVAALRLRPAGVVLPDSPPAVIQAAVRLALQDAGVIFDASLSAILTDPSRRGPAGR